MRSGHICLWWTIYYKSVDTLWSCAPSETVKMELEPEASLLIAISPGSPLVAPVLPGTAALGFLGLEMLSSEG